MRVKMKNIIIAFAAAVMAGDCCAANVPQGSDSGQGTARPAETAKAMFRVGTCNVRVWSKKDLAEGNVWDERRDDLIALLRRLDMDVFGFQEVHGRPYRELCAGLKEWELVDDYDVSTPVAYRKSRFDLVKKGVFWLSETPDVPRAKPRERLRVDYIYVSNGIRVCDFVTHDDKRPGTDRYPSDHYPLSATIELPPDSTPDTMK